MSEVTYFILYILQHNKGRHQPFWSDPLNPIFRLSLLFFLAGTLRSLPVQVRLLLVLAAAGGAQRGARFRQFSSPLLLLAKKSEYIRIQVNLN